MIKPSHVANVLFGAGGLFFAIKYFKEKNKNNKLNITIRDKDDKHLQFRYKIIGVKEAYKDTAVEAQLEKALDEDLKFF